MERLKAGVVGMGFMGYAHVEALRRLGTVEVAAIASGSGAEKRAKALGISQWYDSYQEMILHGGIDAIHICTPNGTHYAIAKFALEHGVHVLCEKPFTVTVSEAEELCELAKKTGLQNAVNFHNRFYPMANTIRQKNRFFLLSEPSPDITQAHRRLRFLLSLHALSPPPAKHPSPEQAELAPVRKSPAGQALQLP